ncbi:MAG TPA: choice-of-anchor D domain-containing protein [Kofleriaceae bacterium]|nr:choice-of-anchor D domain-containing protein [Kofleriaceae bacterium]
MGTPGSASRRLVHIGLSSLLVLGALAGAASAGPAISIAPDPIEFYGPPLFVQVGAAPGVRQSGYYEVRNTGDAPLVVTEMAITGPDAGIMGFDDQLDPSCGSGQVCTQTFSLAPGEARWVPVTCTAAQAGYFAASLGITSNATSGASTAALSCLGLRTPVIQVVPASLDFGTAHKCPLGDVCGPSCETKPSTQTLTITNAAEPPSRLDFHITPTLPSDVYDDFLVGDMCAEGSGGCSLPAGASLPIEITFRPRKSVVHDTPLTLVSQYPGQPPVSIPFYAEGGHGALAFDTPPFLGSVLVGQTLTTTFTVHNAGRSCITFRSPVSAEPEIQVDLTGHPDPIVLQSGASYSWTVTCTPTEVGTVTAYLDFDLYFESISFVSRMVTCEGIADSLDVTPASVAFVGADEVPVGSSATRRLTVRNTGPIPTQLAAMTSSDPRFTAALVAGTLPLTLAPDEVAEVDVTFTPTDNVRASGTIAFATTLGASFTVGAIGDGFLFRAEARPAALDFRMIEYRASATLPIELNNTGDRPLIVHGFTLDLPDEYTVTGLEPGTTLAPGANLAFEVHVTPTMLGPRPATLVIDLDPAADLEIPLDALALDPGSAASTPGRGGGCAAGPPAPGLLLGATLALALVLVRRRRRRALI